MNDFAVGDRVTVPGSSLKGVMKVEEFTDVGVILSGPCSTPGCDCKGYVHVPCEWVRLVMHGSREH